MTSVLLGSPGNRSSILFGGRIRTGRIRGTGTRLLRNFIVIFVTILGRPLATICLTLIRLVGPHGRRSLGHHRVTSVRTEYTRIEVDELPVGCFIRESVLFANILLIFFDGRWSLQVFDAGGVLQGVLLASYFALEAGHAKSMLCREPHHRRYVG